jgi:hypothetical protein
MKHNYVDILKRINEPPTWYDEYGTPRFGKFTPDLCPNIYASIVILMRIVCQDCRKPFDVEMHWDTFHYHNLYGRKQLPHYGDPPIHKCVGDTMNCEDIEILEHWERHDFKWVKKRVRKGWQGS